MCVHVCVAFSFFLKLDQTFNSMIKYIIELHLCMILCGIISQHRVVPNKRSSWGEVEIKGVHIIALAGDLNFKGDGCDEGGVGEGLVVEFVIGEGLDAAQVEVEHLGLLVILRWWCGCGDVLWGVGAGDGDDDVVESCGEGIFEVGGVGGDGDLKRCVIPIVFCPERGVDGVEILCQPRIVGVVFVEIKLPIEDSIFVVQLVPRSPLLPHQALTLVPQIFIQTGFDGGFDEGLLRGGAICGEEEAEFVIGGVGEVFCGELELHNCCGKIWCCWDDMEFTH